MIKRKTVLSLESLDNLFTDKEEEYLKQVINNSNIMERILLNSKSLYKKIQKIKLENKELDKKTSISLIKYLIRMGSRPQPFGLNSGLSYNNINQNEIKTVEISSTWKEEFLNKFQLLLIESEKVKLVVNPLIQYTDKQYILERFEKNEYIYTYLKSSNLLIHFLDSLHNPKEFKEVILSFSGRIEKKEIISNIIIPLLREKVIRIDTPISNINSDSKEFFSYIYSHLNNNLNLISSLRDIENELIQYKDSEIGKGIGIYENLLEKMSSLCECSSYINVNLYIKDHDENNEDIHNVNLLQEDLKIMKYFDNKQLFDWDKYYNLFISKFGLYTKVPFLKMLDSYEGIGSPHRMDISNENKKIELYILNKLTISLYNNEKILKLNTEDYLNIEKLYEEKTEKRDEISFDCKVIPYNNKFIIPPNALSFPRNSYTGRFSFNSSKRLKPSKNYHEIAYLPTRFQDVAQSHKSEGAYYIDALGYNDNNLIRVPINEIFVIVDDNRFYLIHHDELISPVSTHLYSYRNFNEHPAIIFLQEYSLYNFEYPSDFPIEKFNYLEYVPRIEYKSLMLTYARINMSFKIESSKEEIINTIKNLINKYNFNINKYVYILEGDRYIPVPTNNIRSIDFIESFKKNIKGTYYLTLMEAPELENLSGEDKVCDYIFSSDEEVYSDSQIYEPSKFDIHRGELDSNYSYFNIYYRKGKRNKIVNRLIFITEKLKLDDMFFVNFIDENHKEHIRLRYTKEDSKELQLEEYLYKLVISEEITDFSKSLFIPEVNRYGGEIVSKIVYKFFSLDTQSMHILSEKYKSYNKVNSALFLTSFMLLQFLGDNLESLYSYIENTVKKDSITLKKFSKNRDFYCNVILDSYKEYKNANDPLLIKQRKMAKEIVDSINQKNLNVDKKYYLIKSIIHMSMNRHFPFERDLENEVNQFIRFGYYNLQYDLGRGNYNEKL